MDDEVPRERRASAAYDSGRAVSRILSAPKNRRRESFVSAAYTRNLSAHRGMERAAPWFPIWPCTRWGFPCLADYSASGELLPHLFTLAAPLRARRFVFCGTLRRNALAFLPRVSLSELRGIAPSGVRTFLPRPLQPEAILHPAGIMRSLTGLRPFRNEQIQGTISPKSGRRSRDCLKSI